MILPWKEASWKDLETGQAVPTGRQDGRTSLELELEPQQVRVFLIEKMGK